MMDRQEIAYFIRTSGIGVDLITLNETLNFLQNHVGNLNVSLQHYQILSATAIVGETIILNDITHTKRAKSGITLQHVMKHIGKLSKELYLQVLAKQVQKWREAPMWLKTKTYNLQISYRIYKKYRSVFDQLCQQKIILDEDNTFNLMGIFWIVYLFIKNQNSQFDNPVQTTTLLHSIIQFVFSQIDVQISHKKSSQIFRKQFLESRMPSEDKYSQLRTLIINKLNDIHEYRYQGKRIDVKQLSDIHYSQRYLDDSNDLYEKLMHKLPENTINQLYFLELAKNLTPCTIKVMSEAPSQLAITKKIDFTQSDDDEDFDPFANQIENQDIQDMGLVEQKKCKFESTPKKDDFFRSVMKTQPISPFRVFSSRGLTPVSARHMNSNWLNGITNNIIKQQLSQIRRIYQKYIGLDFNKSNQIILGLITNSIYEFTPDCKDFTKRQNQIYQLYSYFINRIAQSHTLSQMQQIFSKFQNYRSILCLSTDLFNYANQGLEGSYTKYCKVYQISILQGHKATNWFGKHISLPKTIESYLYSVEKKILIVEIWHNNEGYFFLSKQQSTTQDNLLVKRLQKHVNERTQQLCFKMNILDGQIIKIVNLVKYIVNKRIILLKNHRIDQIIVCSIASILSINQSNSKYTLEQIFDHYNQLILSFYSSKNDLYDSDGNRIDLINFYNQVFLPSLEDIINGQDNSNILSTPVRLQRQKSKDLGLQMTPFSSKFKQAPKIVSFPKIKYSEDEMLPQATQQKRQRRRPVYLQNIAQKINNSLKHIQQPQNQDNDDQSSSPTFKTPQQIERGFSFGKFGNP